MDVLTQKCKHLKIESSFFKRQIQISDLVLCIPSDETCRVIAIVDKNLPTSNMYLFLDWPIRKYPKDTNGANSKIVFLLPKYPEIIPPFLKNNLIWNLENLTIWDSSLKFSSFGQNNFMKLPRFQIMLA